MRIYIISNDGIALCRETPATVSDGEIVVTSIPPRALHQTCRARSSADERAGSSISSPQRIRSKNTHGLAVPHLTVFTWFELRRT